MTDARIIHNKTISLLTKPFVASIVRVLMKTAAITQIMMRNVMRVVVSPRRVPFFWSNCIKSTGQQEEMI